MSTVVNALNIATAHVVTGHGHLLAGNIPTPVGVQPPGTQGLTTILSWIAWTVLLVIMIAMMGPRHPPTLNEDEPLDRGRLLLAAVALVVLIVCFTPAPIGPFLGTP